MAKLSIVKEFRRVSTAFSKFYPLSLLSAEQRLTPESPFTTTIDPSIVTKVTDRDGTRQNSGFFAYRRS